jgi:hypothetical protein
MSFPAPENAKPGELARAGFGKNWKVFSLAGFVTRPQAEIQIGAALRRGKRYPPLPKMSYSSGR